MLKAGYKSKLTHETPNFIGHEYIQPETTKSAQLEQVDCIILKCKQNL